METQVELEPALQVLHSVFGYEKFRGQQQAVIQQLTRGRDVLVLMPTGGGKSLCYQIPALLIEGVAVVVSPLIALMQDQVNALLQLGVKAAFLNSTLSFPEVQNIERQLHAGELDLLYIAPERLGNERTLGLLQRIKVALFAIDEAHCVSQWGHDFRVDYLKLSLLHEQFPQIPRIALTATADERTRTEIIARLNLHQAEVFVSGFDRPNIFYRIVQKQNARQQLYDFIRREHPDDAGIIYCLSRKKVEATAEWLANKGLNALPYHAGLPNDVRQQNQHRFLMEEGLIIVATIAFGMGIDKPNVRFVAHLDLPKSVEGYYQETGRAGRDGLAANAWMAYGLQDVVTLRQMLDSSNADEAHKRIEFHKLDAMLALCEMVGCRRRALLAYFGDQLEQDCGNCDTCREKVETWDGTVAAQKALSCIYRTGQRFGAGYLIDVLLGRENERISRYGHDRQSTYGIGVELDEKQWRSVFRQLVARNLVEIDFESYGAFKLTEHCRKFLRGEQTLMLRKDVAPSRQSGQRKTARSFTNERDSALWEALRGKRREIADQQQVPPYVIFHDATLMEMLELKPTSHRQMSHISGVGKRKLELYADAFLAVLNDFSNLSTSQGAADARYLSETAAESVALFRLGYSVEQVARELKIKSETIFTYLAQALEMGEVLLEEVIDLKADEIAQVEQFMADLPEAQRKSLKIIFDQFDGEYSYGVLGCIRANFERQLNS